VRTKARPAALAAVAFLVIAALATALSGQPALSVVGPYNWGTGLLFVGLLVGAWSLGASLGEGDVPLIEKALLVGIGVNAVVAIVQGAVALEIAPFTRYEGRAAGLLGNPVHLATLCVAGLALLLPRVRSRPAPWASLAVLFAAAVELSGSRFALGLAVLLALVTVVRHRRRGLTAGAAVALGLLVGVGVGALGGATTGAGRVQAGGESVGTTARLRVWASAGQAIAHRPLLGSGPGLFGEATTRYRDLALVRAEGPDRRFVDAHNLPVEYATTTGFLGLAALATWLALAARRASGPLLAFALLVLAMHLVEPQFVATTPLAFLALGAAARVGLAQGGRVLTLTTALLCVAALAAAGRLLWGDYELHQAGLDFRPGQARAAVRALPPWSDPPQVAAKVALYESITTHSPAGRVAALRWSRLAVDRDPHDPIAWSAYGEIQLYYGDAAAAERSFRSALRADPWSVKALQGLANAAVARGDRATARRALQRAVLADAANVKLRHRLATL
jgi:hypothetical protein